MAANNHLIMKLFQYPHGNDLANVKWYLIEDDLEPFLVFSDNSELPAEMFIPEGLIDMIDFEIPL